MYESMYIEDIDAKNPICTLSTPLIEHVTMEQNFSTKYAFASRPSIALVATCEFFYFFYQSIQVLFFLKTGQASSPMLQE